MSVFGYEGIWEDVDKEIAREFEEAIWLGMDFSTKEHIRRATYEELALKHEEEQEKLS